jgi:hypothetical protein
MLTAAVGRYHHALVRDLLALGYRPRDMFTDRLTFSELVSIVVAAPPTSSLRWFLDNGWTRTDHLLANMTETAAGVAELSSPYERPGIEDRSPGASMFPADVMSWEEMDRRELQRYGPDAPNPGRTHSRVWR